MAENRNLKSPSVSQSNTSFTQPGSNRGPNSSGGPGPNRVFGGQRGMPVVKAKDFKGTIARLWGYLSQERRQLIVVFIFIAISTGIGLVVPYLIGHAIDAMSAGKGAVALGVLGITAGMLIVAYVTDACIQLFQGWFMAGVSQRVVKNLRNMLFSKLQELPVSFFDTRTHGELMSRLSNDIENVSGVLSSAVIQLMASSLTIAGSFVMMLILSPLLTLASLITIPLVFLVTRTIARRTKPLFKEQQVTLGKINGHIEETISGIQVIKAFSREDNVIRQFDDINIKLRTVSTKAQVWSGFIMPLMNVINNIGFAALAGVGGILAVNSLVTVGTIASFVSYSRQFVRPLNELANMFNMLQSAVAGAERVFEILDEQAEQEDVPSAVVLEKPEGHIEFKNVSFGYRADVPVLDNISFYAPAGSTTALVGPTGAGKTTIVNLITRFYDVTEGSIYLDDRDIREYTRDSLRSCFGIVLQDTYLFSGSVKENIRYGKQDAPDKEIIDAAKIANADVFINRLPKGYDTILSEGGSNLSQGQRQLLAIARAVLANPSVLILDEATSSVDTRTELNIQEAMIKLMKGRTSFIIAHRLSTIRNADTIMVIDKGQILEKGNHEELLSLDGGVYSRMYYSQFRGIQEDEEE